ncbi:FAD-dependent monooxygenase [Paenibacillus spongiae]|uniref:FAD-dependent monooxygenase n=1 Tax=Paenibacillus spongiae TaxID=2909671 RepID=A0ABY5SGB8_9BACL|nr:FAD-dependent monooxygenase [Paenibacillus spongiae]UVI32699.1 FAD-dependent monooxygenase [Paenibacillus spongiae]
MMEHTDKTAIVIGAGIGGLSAAIALQQIGWRVKIFDKVSELADVGAGIVLAANAMKALERLGAAEQVRRRGAAVGKAEVRTWDGKLIVDLPTARQAERYGTPGYLIHRGELQKVLLQQLRPETEVKLGYKLVSWDMTGSQVTACFEDGSKTEGALLIGADGVRSAVRERLFGSEPLRYSGFTALRGIAAYDDPHYSAELGGGFEAWGPGKRFGFSHLGQGRVFWFAAINSPADAHVARGLRKQAALQHFQGWYNPIEAVIEATEESAILSHPIYDRKPLKAWSTGCVTLLGDAAHPMLPNLGQGGAQAMEDAVVLAFSLQSASGIPEALAMYERLRIGRTARMVSQSRKMGRMVQLENPLAVAARNALLRTIPAGFQVKQLDWIMGEDVYNR